MYIKLEWFDKGAFQEWNIEDILFIVYLFEDTLLCVSSEIKNVYCRQLLLKYFQDTGRNLGRDVLVHTKLEYVTNNGTIL